MHISMTSFLQHCAEVVPVTLSWLGLRCMPASHFPLKDFLQSEAQQLLEV